MLTRGFEMSTKPDTTDAFVAGDPSLPIDPVIEVYKKDVDRGLLRENLKLTPEQRLVNLQKFIDAIEELREAAKAART
jgi:hypothetical protein